ncbi:hypothetical protein MKX03_008774, partial [Papaver bracteatum]
FSKDGEGRKAPSQVRERSISPRTRSGSRGYYRRRKIHVEEGWVEDEAVLIVG